MGYSTIAGHSNLDILKETVEGAAAVVAVGTCAAFGGLPRAHPNPTGAVAVQDIITNKPIINVSGCPPIPTVITGVLAQYLTFGTLPEMDGYKRPLAFFGQSIHDRCYRRPFYDKGLFAETFDDEGARAGWCLYRLGCKGPSTYNACATMRWNAGTSWPVESGHPCLGCSEPDFWDAGSFYQALSVPMANPTNTMVAAGIAGAVIGGVGATMAKKQQQQAVAKRQPVTIEELEQKL
jgi:hydrogenase small subunit